DGVQCPEFPGHQPEARAAPAAALCTIVFLVELNCDRVWPKRKKRRQLIVPSSRGGDRCAIKKSCEATFGAETGWSEMFLTTPATPPPEEGTSSSLRFRPLGT